VKRAISSGPRPAWPLAGHASLPRPNAPLRIVVPQAAGGTADTLARVLGERMEARLGMATIVDNRPGANGLIGTEFVRRAAADGETLLVASTATHAIAPHVLRAVEFDPVRDFAPIINVAWQTKVAIASLSVPATTLREFVAYARANPGRLNYASVGIGSTSHVDAELLASATGIKLVHIPYRGSGQTVAALATGEVQLLLASVTAALGAIRAGQVRALAVLSEQRSALLPQVPTIGEAGVPAPDVRNWIGLVAPAETPPSIVAAFNHLVASELADPALRAWLDQQGLEPIGGTSEAFAARIRADVERWGTIVRRLGVHAA
jgi:tripartite-type tricarboxylate transporter receptor subunit TctC